MKEIPICEAVPPIKTTTLYSPLSHTHEEEFTDMLEMAVRITGCPVAILCVTNDKDFALHAKFGTSIDIQTEKKLIAYAARIISATGESYMSGDAHGEKTDIAFYAAVPVKFEKTNFIGAISVFDSEKKELSPEQGNLLKLLAKQAENTLTLQWKNEELKKETKTHMRLKAKAIKQNLLKQEKQKKEIATQLHEHLAQELASCKLYLQVAEEREHMRLSLLRKANENMGKLIAEICRLSDDILPQSLDKLPLEALLTELTAEIKTVSDIDVEFTISGDIENICYEPRMVLFKIIERWTKRLMFKDVTKIQIQISCFDTTTVTILDDGSHHNTKEIAADSTTVKLENRIKMLGGWGKLAHLPSRGNALTIEI